MSRFLGKGKGRRLWLIAVLANWIWPAFAQSEKEQLNAFVADVPFLIDACHRYGVTGYPLFPDQEIQLACVNGKIDFDSLSALSYWTEDEVPLVVIVNTPGGIVGAALDIVEIWGVGRYDIVIAGKCHSSCANYFFAGARYKYISGISEFGYHGGVGRTKAESYLDAIESGLIDELPPISTAALQKLESVQFDWSAQRSKAKAIYGVQGSIEDVMYMLPAAKHCAYNAPLFEDDRAFLNALASNGVSSASWRPSRTALQNIFQFSDVRFQNPQLFKSNVYKIRLQDGAIREIEFADECLVENYDLHLSTTRW